MLDSEELMANAFGTDILIQAEDLQKAADFYVKELGFTVTDKNPKMIGLHGKHINLFIEPGTALGPLLGLPSGALKTLRPICRRRVAKSLRTNRKFPGFTSKIHTASFTI
jgi:catechol 2,3-dioxygenase-like lactoylglutathione lyase family enzyme